MHFPFPAYGNKLLAEALAQAVGEGLCRAVGVCNFGGEQMGELHGLLAQRGVPLASNQARPVQHLNLGFRVCCLTESGNYLRALPRDMWIYLVPMCDYPCYRAGK